MKGRQLTDVSRRRFDVSQSPVQLQGSPDFGRLRDSSSPFSSLLLLFPSFLRQPRPPSFQLLRSHPFSSVNEPVERKGERVVEQRESKLRPVPGYFLSLPLTRARRFSLPLFLFFSSLPPFPFSFCPPPLLLHQPRFLATIGEANRNFRFSKSMALLLLPVYSFYCPRQ